MFSRKHDCFRALCEDPELIQSWFDIVRNTVAKYGIADADICNFVETGFTMGETTPNMVVISSKKGISLSWPNLVTVNGLRGSQGLHRKAGPF